MPEPQRTPNPDPPSSARLWIRIASVLVRLSAVYLAILTALFVAFRFPLFLAPGIAVAAALAWYSMRLARRHL